ncbi:MAG: DUF5522 domain-containing protein [Bacteroidota bacterium]
MSEKNCCSFCGNEEAKPVIDLQVGPEGISTEALKWILNTGKSHICADCIQKFNDLSAKARNWPFPQKPYELKEGVHYYLENGYWVFTEFYLFQRGYCCESSCRHCVYGFKVKSECL